MFTLRVTSQTKMFAFQEVLFGKTKQVTVQATNELPT